MSDSSKDSCSVAQGDKKLKKNFTSWYNPPLGQGSAFWPHKIKLIWNHKTYFTLKNDGEPVGETPGRDVCLNWLNMRHFLLFQCHSITLISKLGCVRFGRKNKSEIKRARLIIFFFKAAGSHCSGAEEPQAFGSGAAGCRPLVWSMHTGVSFNLASQPIVLGLIHLHRHRLLNIIVLFKSFKWEDESQCASHDTKQFHCGRRENLLQYMSHFLYYLFIHPCPWSHWSPHPLKLACGKGKQSSLKGELRIDLTKGQHSHLSSMESPKLLVSQNVVTISCQ